MERIHAEMEKMELEERHYLSSIDNIDERMRQRELSNPKGPGERQPGDLDRELRRRRREQASLELELRQKGLQQGHELQNLNTGVERRRHHEDVTAALRPGQTVTSKKDSVDQPTRNTSTPGVRTEGTSDSVPRPSRGTMKQHFTTDDCQLSIEALSEVDYNDELDSVASTATSPKQTTERKQEDNRTDMVRHTSLISDRSKAGLTPPSFLMDNSPEKAYLPKHPSDGRDYSPGLGTDRHREKLKLVEDQLATIEEDVEERQKEEDAIRHRIHLLKRKEHDMQLESQRLSNEEQERAARLQKMDLKHKELKEDRQREEVLNQLRAEEHQMEMRIREQEQGEREQQQKLERMRNAEQRLRIELTVPKTRPQEQMKRESHDDQLLDWTSTVRRKQQMQPDLRRLTALFETEKEIAQAIAAEMSNDQDADPGHQEFAGEPDRTREQHHRHIDTNRQPGHVYIKPTINVFSGMEPIPKNESSFEVWSLEVECLIQTEVYPEYLVNQAIRNSLRGEAKRVLLPLGPLATSTEIIEKIESVFGNVASAESVLQHFYTTRQEKGESVTSWGLRLEEILQKAIMKGHIKQQQRNEMLRRKFWRGLYSEKLKTDTRVYFETELNFEALRRNVRTEECEMMSTGRGADYESHNANDRTAHHDSRKTTDRTVQHKPLQLDRDQHMLTDLLSRMERMEKKIDSMKKPRNQRNWGARNRPSLEGTQDKTGGEGAGPIPPSQAEGHLNR